MLLNLRLLSLAVASTFLAFSCCHFQSGTASASSEQRVIIFDAGSSGTRVYIYDWDFKGCSTPPTCELNADTLPRIALAGPTNKPWVLKTPGGLDTLAETPEKVEAYLEPLLQFIRDKAGTKKQIPTYFYATGGVRKLSDEQERVLLSAVKRALQAQSHLDTQEVRELTGQDEGTYSWIAVNALAKRFGKQQKTLGVIELGGASLQVAFVPEHASKQDTVEVQVGQHRYQLYSYSYDGLGREDALAQLKREHHNHCFASEDKASSGAAACIAEITHRIELGSPDCFEQCGMRNRFQPSLYGDFVALENFYHVGNEHGHSELTLQELINLGDRVCSLSLREYRKIYPETPKFKNACFDLSFLRAILVGSSKGGGLGFDTKGSYRAVKDIDSMEPSWTYGVVLSKILANQKNTP